ncbi:MAG TPA: phosphopantetheine-binding protein, partial [Rhodanobacteraceae bacterium]
APAPVRGNGMAHAPVPPPAAAPPAAPQPPIKVEASEPVPARSNGSARKPDAAMDRAGLANVLLGIVEEKTGYPRDMVGLDQNLEADLGIDSIKRIEVVGAMLQSLPDKQREALTAHRSKLNTQATLNGMLDLLASSIEKAAAA